MIQKLVQNGLFTLKPLAKLGKNGIDILVDLGRTGIFLKNMIFALVKQPFRFQELLKQLKFIGFDSIPVIFFTALSTGMVLGLQGYYSLHKFGAESILGSAVAMSIILELGPVLAALMVIGRAGSAICAELGIMRISEQLDALSCMAIDPFRYLLAPKLLATLISLPILTIFFDLVGIFGGYLAGVGLMGVSSGDYFNSMQESITNHDIQLGLIKSLVFALLIIWICSSRGYFVHCIKGVGFGAEAVSKVTTQAVVLSSIAVLVFDYLLTAVLL